ncbi:MAG: acetylxylan esterase [Clostridia bacterium]|nr:acetylxylan esterase [Clostridia bacterium]
MDETVKLEQAEKEQNPRFSPDACHERLLRERTPLLRYNEERDYDAWRKDLKAKLIELIGDMPERVPLNIQIEWKEERDDFTEYRFVFDSEADTSVPAHLLIPRGVKLPCPVVICLQGHSTGMHISLARAIYDKDDETILDGDRDFALQIVREGYAALVLEQRAFGERISQRIIHHNPYYRTTCYLPAMAAQLLGRTFIGERVHDIMCAIDALGEFSEIDTDRVACMGNSGGGTATYYAACLDERIKVAMPSCSVCSFEQSIGTLYHCACNYVPGIAKYMDMGDMAALIAPRKLIVVAGRVDTGFLLPGVLSEYEQIQRIYKRAGCPDSCRLVVGDGGHRFYAHPSWEYFAELSGWKQ